MVRYILKMCLFTTHPSSVLHNGHNIGTESILAQQTVNQYSDTVVNIYGFIDENISISFVGIIQVFTQSQ